MRRFILGTAGHVDHGKTELVRVLTGHDTDRLKEEKERGISIELGFAPLPLTDDTFFGVIDVPGHERFVKQMVAGAGGVDVAMLLIAADEGVMPQTEEHLEVLRALPIDRGVVVVSKSDLIDEETRILLQDELDELVVGTFLENAPVVFTSAKTGAGIDDLRATLVDCVKDLEPRDASGPFHLHIDRVFHQKGIGVVVTGSAVAGTVKIGDTLEHHPSGEETRVRELQSFSERKNEGRAGERLALALQGMKLGQVSRGDTLATPRVLVPSHIVDVRLSLASYYDFEIKNRERVRVHHGAREVMARAILLDTDALLAGETGLAQLALESPIVATKGDHVVIRKYSPARVVGGATVIDPQPTRHRRSDRTVVEQLRIKEHGSADEILMARVRAAGMSGVPVRDVDPDTLAALTATEQVVKIDQLIVANSALQIYAELVDDAIQEFLADKPLVWGMDKAELQQRTNFPHGASTFNRVLKSVSELRPIFVKANRVRAGSPDIALSPDTERDVESLSQLISSHGVKYESRVNLETHWAGVASFVTVVQFLKELGRVHEVENGLIHQNALNECLAALSKLFDETEQVTVPQFKDVLGVTRKHAIPLLEYFDAQGYTIRDGNHRVRGRAFPGISG